MHRSLGSRLAGEGILEARVRRDGLVGRIDILTEVPVEVKTASTLIEPSELPAQRPEHLEQLGMYCALVDRPIGRLLTLVTGPDGIADVQAVDVTFRSPSRILSEMVRRSDLLRAALGESRVDGLPRCPWFGRGCEYEDAGACACTGEEKPTLPALGEEVGPLEVRDDVRERVRSALSEPMARTDPNSVTRFREILYPRRAFFERTRPAPSPPAEAAPPPLKPDLYARLSEAVESGPPGEVARLPGKSVEPDEEVVAFRGRPYLLRTSRAWDRFRPDELVARAPQYALELGLRCATTGAGSGIVIVGFERAEVDRERIQVLELRFAPLTPFSRMYRERSQALALAVRDGTPATLLACPEWMASDCPYGAECGCGSSESRATR